MVRIKAVDNSSVSLSFRYLEIDIVVIVGNAIAGVYLWRSPDLRWLSIVVFAISGVFGIFLIAAFVVIPPLAYRREPKFLDDYILTFSTDGIHFQTAHIDSHLEWRIYSRALVDAHSYVLYYGSAFTVIPKRVFQSIEQQKAFDELLANHVSEVVRKK